FGALTIKELRIQDSDIRNQKIEPIMRKPAKTFQDLIVWQKAHQLVLKTYFYTKSFPKYELYGLSSQFRRAAVSIAANIAEGFKKRGKKDKLRFLNISHGSLEECRYYMILSKDLGYGETKDLNEILQEVSKLLDGYSKAILNSVS
ncbi:MAG: four helix bundle protein, partial [Balneolaceae bacterium]